MIGPILEETQTGLDFYIRGFHDEVYKEFGQEIFENLSGRYDPFLVDQKEKNLAKKIERFFRNNHYLYSIADKSCYHKSLLNNFKFEHLEQQSFYKRQNIVISLAIDKNNREFEKIKMYLIMLEGEDNGSN